MNFRLERCKFYTLSKVMKKFYSFLDEVVAAEVTLNIWMVTVH
jgi:hypothetical protein